MSIRIRIVNGTITALCGANSKAEPGDVYLHDGQDHAVREKLYLDWESEEAHIRDNLKAEVERLQNLLKIERGMNKNNFFALTASQQEVVGIVGSNEALLAEVKVWEGRAKNSEREVEQLKRKFDNKFAGKKKEKPVALLS